MRRSLTTLVLTVALSLGGMREAAALSLIRDAEIEGTLHALAAPIFRAAGLREDAVEMILLGDSRPNAFVFDGRRMAITTGLIQDMSDPSELQGVIAHETGHITGGHQARRGMAMRNLEGPALIATLLTVAGTAAAGGGGAGAIGAGMGTQAVALRALLAYTRAEEAAADQAALTYLEAAEVNPAGMRDVLERFRGQEVFLNADQDPYALTHPLSAARIAFVERRSAESPHTGPSSPESVYRFNRMKAKLDGFLDHPRTTLAAAGKPDDEFDMLRRAVAWHRLPDPSKALELADALIVRHPADPYYHELKGQFLLESGRGAQAVAPLREAVRLAPDQPLLRGMLGRALLALDEPTAAAEAVALLEQGAGAGSAGDPAVLRDLAMAYARAGREGEAALATAERLANLGSVHDARIQAERARKLLPEGSPKWLRADDIVASLKPLD